MGGRLHGFLAQTSALCFQIHLPSCDSKCPPALDTSCKFMTPDTQRLGSPRLLTSDRRLDWTFLWKMQQELQSNRPRMQLLILGSPTSTQLISPDYAPIQ